MKKWLMPVLTASMVLTIASPAAAKPNESPKVKSVEFIGMEAPQTSEQKNAMYSNASVKVTYTGGEEKVIPLSYETLFRPGDKIAGKTTGVTTYANGSVITKSGGAPYISEAPDMNSLIQLPGS